MILDTIVEKKKESIESHFQSITFPQGRIARAMKAKQGLFILGEIKKASPSKGLIAPEFDVEQLAKEYTYSGVDAISVLCEEHFFQGSIQHLITANSFTSLPLLRKDFIIDTREIVEASQAGASMILLIVAMLDDVQLLHFYQCARMLGLECIVEVHNEIELTRALAIHPEIIGINNRNLHTFEVSLDTTKQLAKLIPDTIAVISESGIFTHEQLEEVAQYGIDGVLIGESFMRCKDKKKHLQELFYGTY